MYHSVYQQVSIFVFSVSMAYFTESINEYAAINWKTFSKQQYFDSNGLFISTVFSMPILLNCMCIIGAWLYNSTQMMAQLKSAQLKQRSRKEAAGSTKKVQWLLYPNNTLLGFSFKKMFNNSFKDHRCYLLIGHLDWSVLLSFGLLVYIEFKSIYFCW